MTEGSVIVAIVGVGVGLLAVLVPLSLVLASGIRSELNQVRADVAEVRRDVHAVGERVARIEGQLSGPPSGSLLVTSRSGRSEPVLPEPARED